MKITSYSVRQTLRVGTRIAGLLQGGDIICLCGQLGSGKTILTKGIAQGLGIKKEAVTSPTFVLLNQYNRANIPLFHFDLYRLEAERDILALGYEEYFYNEGISVIEWADRLGPLLPKERMQVHLDIRQDKGRLLEFTAFGRRYQGLLASMQRRLR